MPFYQEKATPSSAWIWIAKIVTGDTASSYDLLDFEESPMEDLLVLAERRMSRKDRGQTGPGVIWHKNAKSVPQGQQNPA